MILLLGIVPAFVSTHRAPPYDGTSKTSHAVEATNVADIFVTVGDKGKEQEFVYHETEDDQLSNIEMDTETFHEGNEDQESRILLQKKMMLRKRRRIQASTKLRRQLTAQVNIIARIVAQDLKLGRNFRLPKKFTVKVDNSATPKQTSIEMPDLVVTGDLDGCALDPPGISCECPCPED